MSSAVFGIAKRSGFRRGCGSASWRLPPSDLVDQVHVSGALSGACTGKGSQMANPRPTPKPGNLGPQTSLTRCTFPVPYPVLAPGKGPRMANPRPTPKPGPGSKFKFRRFRGGSRAARRVKFPPANRS